VSLPDATRAKLAASRLFAGIAPDLLERMFRASLLRQARGQEVIFSRGEAADKVFVILAGMVRISTMGENGKRIVAEIFREQEVFGELAVIDEQPRTADAIAYGPVELLQIPANAFNAVLSESAPFGRTLLRIVAARLRRTYSLLEDASLLNLELRLAKQVLYLMGLGASGTQAVRIHSRMHQEDLADLLGATSRSIITILNKWRIEGLATFDGRSAQLTIQDLERFRALAHDFPRR
jgi:CRP-like cAMP-binding protein